MVPALPSVPQTLAMQDLCDASRYGAADPEVVAATVTRIGGGDADAWLREWTQAGGEAWVSAKRTGDAELFRHAASYYAAALIAIAESDGSVDETQLWRRQRECWELAVACGRGQPAPVPYEGATLPGYFFAGGPGRRPLVIIDHGGLTPTSRTWGLAGAEAHARGYHWMTFDGPGGRAVWPDHGLLLRHDWEAVLAPVADAMIGRPDVDGARMAVVGADLAGFGVARALAYEHRFAAAALVPGIVDAARPWLAALVPTVQRALLDGDRDAFDRELHLAELFAPGMTQRLRRATDGFGAPRVPLYDIYQRIRCFALGEEVAQITTPLLVSSPAADGGGMTPWAGQGCELHEWLSSPAALCLDATRPEPILDWLDGHLL
jgi:hypothetical protein